MFHWVRFVVFLVRFVCVCAYQPLLSLPLSPSPSLPPSLPPSIVRPCASPSIALRVKPSAHPPPLSTHLPSLMLCELAHSPVSLAPTSSPSSPQSGQRCLCQAHTTACPAAKVRISGREVVMASGGRERYMRGDVSCHTSSNTTLLGAETWKEFPLHPRKVRAADAAAILTERWSIGDTAASRGWARRWKF
jgi:hypothetical protein